MLSSAAKSIARLPWFKNWLEGKQSIIESAESNLLSFHRRAPKAFWASLILNLACHGIAILEVYLLLYFMGARAGLLGALVIEAFTKLINVVGALNPGNFGTYEAGNIILTRLLGITGAPGLALGLCRRVRSLFWKAMGLLCLVAMSRSTQQAQRKSSRVFYKVFFDSWGSRCAPVRHERISNFEQPERANSRIRRTATTSEAIKST